MHNHIHFELLILALVMFIAGGENMDTDVGLFWQILSILATCIWVNSCLTLYMRVTKSLKTVTTPMELDEKMNGGINKHG